MNLGIARYILEEGITCEFSLSVSDAYATHGVGKNLMEHLITHAQKQGLETMVGYVLKNNQKMLNLVNELGFAEKSIQGDSDFYKVTLNLQE